MDVLALVEKEERSDGWDGYAAEPGKMYPAAIAHIRECLETGTQGDGVISNQYFPKAADLPEQAWEFALMPRGEVRDTKHIELRAQALELARLWFTELLHRAVRWQSVGVSNPALTVLEPPGQINVAVGLHILKDHDWRL